MSDRRWRLVVFIATGPNGGYISRFQCTKGLSFSFFHLSFDYVGGRGLSRWIGRFLVDFSTLQSKGIDLGNLRGVLPKSLLPRIRVIVSRSRGPILLCCFCVGVACLFVAAWLACFRHANLDCPHFLDVPARTTLKLLYVTAASSPKPRQSSSVRSTLHGV